MTSELDQIRALIARAEGDGEEARTSAWIACKRIREGVKAGTVSIDAPKEYFSVPSTPHPPGTYSNIPNPSSYAGVPDIEEFLRREGFPFYGDYARHAAKERRRREEEARAAREANGWKCPECGRSCNLMVGLTIECKCGVKFGLDATGKPDPLSVQPGLGSETYPRADRVRFDGSEPGPVGSSRGKYEPWWDVVTNSPFRNPFAEIYDFSKPHPDAKGQAVGCASKRERECSRCNGAVLVGDIIWTRDPGEQLGICICAKCAGEARR